MVVYKNHQNVRCVYYSRFNRWNYDRESWEIHRDTMILNIFEIFKLINFLQWNKEMERSLITLILLWIQNWIEELKQRNFQISKHIWNYYEFSTEIIMNLAENI